MPSSPPFDGGAGESLYPILRFYLSLTRILIFSLLTQNLRLNSCFRKPYRTLFSRLLILPLLLRGGAWTSPPATSIGPVKCLP